MKLNQIRTVLVIALDLHIKPIISPAERLIIDTCPEVSCLNMSSIIGKETRGEVITAGISLSSVQRT